MYQSSSWEIKTAVPTDSVMVGSTDELTASSRVFTGNSLGNQ
jgi:hypothetical protein